MKKEPESSPAENPPLPDSIGQRIRAERLRLGLGLRETARRLGRSSQSYDVLEHSRDPGAKVLLSLKRIGFNLRNIVPDLFE